MTNDIDMWRDIERLEKAGQRKEAEDLLEVYTSRYTEYTTQKKQDEILDKFVDKWGYDPT